MYMYIYVYIELLYYIMESTVDNYEERKKHYAYIYIRTHIYICVSVAFFLLCYPGEALEGPISTGVLKIK